MAQLSDEQLCALNVIVYNERVLAGLTSACDAGERPSLREVVDGAGQTYYDAMGWEMSMDRGDWYDFVRAVDAPGALGDLRVVDVGSLGAGGVGFVDADGTAYAVFRGSSANDHGADLDWFGGSEAALVAQGSAYARYLAGLTGSEVVVSGHAEGGGKAIAASLAAGGLRCVSFDARGLSSTFPQVWASEIADGATRMRNYYAAGDVAGPHVDDVVGKNVAILPTRTGSGHVKDHALASLLDGSLSFGASDVTHRGEGLALDALAAWVAELEARPGAAGPSAALADSFSDFLAWVDEVATDDEKKKLNPFVNELVDAAHSSASGKLGSVFSNSTSTAGLFLSLLVQYPGVRGIAGAGILSALFASSATGGESDRVIEAILSALHVSKRARTNIKSSFTRHVRARIEEGRALTSSQVMAAGSIHDFGDERLEELLSLVAEIESEPFYDVGRWDLWYRIERAAGLLTVDRYQHDIRSYQRKVLDIAGTTAAELRQRFTRARELDAGFARELQVADDALAAVAQRAAGIAWDL